MTQDVDIFIIQVWIQYDPRCRHFYYTSLNSTFKITFIAPYKFSGDKYMNDIYIRTEHKEGKTQDVVLCMVINYYAWFFQR